MFVYKPEWVSHDQGSAIFSVSVHPNGTKFATGGFDQKIKIWNLAACSGMDEKEPDPSIPRKLSTLAGHLGSVNCVRWSPDGRYLASASDDKLVIIWEQTSAGFGSSVFGEQDGANVENYRAVATLRGHLKDVNEVCWSPDGTKLASGGQDSVIFIWDVAQNGANVAQLKEHTGIIKGLAWDPIGKYLVSQSDDLKAILWRTSDWKREALLEGHFQSTALSFSARPSWSPDGSHLTVTNATEKGNPIGAVYGRMDRQLKVAFIGHKKPVVVACYNPQIWASDSDPNVKFSICAVGSLDASLSIWLSSSPRPRFIVGDAFAQGVIDLSWGPDGMFLLAASADGTVCYIELDATKVGGKPISAAAKEKLLRGIYGDLRLGSEIVEDASLLALEQPRGRPTFGHPAPAAAAAAVQGIASMPAEVVAAKQLATKTAEGRKRITPVFLGSGGAVGLSAPATAMPAASSSNPSPAIFGAGSSNSNSASPAQITEKADALAHRLTADVNHITSPTFSPTSSAPKKSSLAYLTTPSQAPPAEKRPRDEIDLTKDLESNSPRQTLKKLKPHPGQLPSTSSATATPSLTTPASAMTPSAPMSASSAAATASAGAAVVPKKKKIKKKTLAPSATATSSAEGGAGASPSSSSGPLRALTKAGSNMAHTALLSAPVVSGRISRQLVAATADKPSVTLEAVHNELPNNEWQSQVSCVSDRPIWKDRVLGKVLLVTGNAHFCAVGCHDGSLYIYSPAGRRLLPALMLDHAPVAMECNSLAHLALVTRSATVYVWNVLERKQILSRPLGHAAIATGTDVKVERIRLLSDGSPLITLSNRHTFAFDNSLQIWVRVSDPYFARSDYSSAIGSLAPSSAKGPLQEAQTRVAIPDSSSAAELASGGSGAKADTIAHLENQVACALSLGSSIEYRHWLHTYVRKLTVENERAKLTEICDSLLGTPHSTPQELLVLTFSRRSLLQELLPVIGQNRAFQRLVLQYKDQLKEMEEIAKSDATS